MTEESEGPQDDTTDGGGWSGADVVHDHAGADSARGGWAADRVVRDHADESGPDSAEAAGWSGTEVARDEGETEQEDPDGGWSGSSVVRDHGSET